MFGYLVFHFVLEKIQFSKTKQLIIDTGTNLKISYTKTFEVAEKNGIYSNVTIVVLDGDHLTLPRLDIYKDVGNLYKKVYSFVPDIPDSEGFYFSMDVIPILVGDNYTSDLSGIFISLTKIGANYWGSYPIYIKYDTKNGFLLTNFYDGNVADNPKINVYMSSIEQDINICNKLNSNETTKSILSQGASYSSVTNNIDLIFYADDNCHACDHNLVTLSYPLNK